eukprot:CAMPEP_0201596280 /NCGR_PEP_ID=MMETSP0190_2-20130828/193014_1 /ASSEMBLY_ACC=CAM_ASM_000263 /TAXON_ID=37353 /ORGANISM="Rosalina sp." /LENGTH=173 /DNA_ID=CAMNT_0048056571 /DNA_START=793 /DNA_END=1311 /DNA_ORIENTATION=-
MYPKILSGVKWTGKQIWDYIFTPLGDFCVKVWNDYLYDVMVTIYDAVANFFNSVYEGIVWTWEKVFDGILYMVDKACDSIAWTWGKIKDSIFYVMDKTWDGIVKGVEWITNKTYQYVLKPLGRLISQIWTNYVRDVFVSIYDNIAAAMTYISDKFNDTKQWMYEKVIIPFKEW